MKPAMNPRDIIGQVEEGVLSPGEGAVQLRAMLGAGVPPRVIHDQDVAAVSLPDPIVRAVVPEPIAVVGMSVRLPGADNAQTFWNNLRARRDVFSPFPSARWCSADEQEENAFQQAVSVAGRGAYLDDVMTFDAEFFGITPREAELMDPQARLFLQGAWAAIEDAGRNPRSMSGERCGVYAGVMINDYPQRILQNSTYALSPQVMQGNSAAMLAARIAYQLDLRGPTASIDTACSSSLVALHLANQALWLGEVETMIVGGVTVYSTPLPFVYMNGAGMISPKGRELPFHRDADGIVPGEGCVVMVLQTLSHALATGAPVHAVVRASGVNSDGKTNGITAPSGRAQAALVREVYQRFGIDPASVDYVECHGTGTALGDPIEIRALNDVYAPAGLPRASVPIGSVKGNTGHTMAAAGLTGLVKAIGVVSTGEVPPTPHLEQINELLPLDEGPFFPVTSPITLSNGARLRRAAVSAFGLSGTNAHAVIEQPPPCSPRSETGTVVVPVSAKTQPQLRRAVHDLRRWLSGPGSDATVADIACTLGTARVHHDCRAVFVAADREQLLAALDGQQPSTAPAPLAAAASAYLAGEEVDWSEYYPPAAYRRLSMPGYPFALDRHDVADPPRAAVGVGDRPTDNTREATASMGLPYDEGTLEGAGQMDTLRPFWQKVEVAPISERPFAGELIVHDPVGDLAPLLRAETGGAGEAPKDQVAVVVRVDHPDRTNAVAGFEAVRTALVAEPRNRSVTLLAVTDQPELILAAGAFVRSVSGETSRVQGRAVLVDDLPGAAAAVREELVTQMSPKSMTVDRRNGQRSVLTWQPYRAETHGMTPIRTDGVYLITGGAGGIGWELALHLAENYGAKVTVCGRSLPNIIAEKAADLPPDLTIHYVQADVADPSQVDDLVAGILAREGRLDGVFHAAGVTRDAFLTRKRSEDMSEVLAAKLEGVLALDQATAGVPLGLFVMFSSVAAVTGNIGQSDYAFGNGFLDAFAVRRSELVARGERSGRTLSIDWPLWDGGGMSVPDPVRAVLREQVGMIPMPVDVGLSTLESLLALPPTRTSPVTCVFYGEIGAWRKHLSAFGVLAGDSIDSAGLRPLSADQSVTKPLMPARSGQEESDARQMGMVISRVAEILGLPSTDLSAATRIEDLGLDSVMVRTLVAELSRTVAPIGFDTLYGARDLGTLAGVLNAKASAGALGGRADRSHRRAARPVHSQGQVSSSPPRFTTRREEADVSSSLMPIAVVGLAGRYPEAPNLSAFWQNLVAGRDTVKQVPEERWPGSLNLAEKGHFLEQVDRFDPEFFGISEYDAALSDPQGRFFLEIAYAALEDGGYAGRRLENLRTADGQARAVGVFVGVTSSDYQLLGAEEWALGGRTVAGGNAWDIANRVSYLLDLHGPSQPVDTACSSSLVALHLACQSIRNGECAAALVGGVNLYLHPSRLLMLRRSGFLADDGRCRGFGEGGTGFGPGEGVGALLIRPLTAAVADHDQIYGVVRGSAVAHGGRTNGYTVPSPAAQARVIRQALEEAAIAPSTITSIEAHGTGTELGDPVEIAALAAEYGSATDAPCSLGTVKSLIGHGESAAGIAAITKVLLELRHKTLVPTLHADPPNPDLHLGATRFHLQQQVEPWQPLKDTMGTVLPRRAGISSFGAGGVNAHVIVEEFREALGSPGALDESSGHPAAQLFVLSGPTPEHVVAQAHRLAKWLREEAVDAEQEVTPARLAYTLYAGRADGPCRVAVVADDLTDLADHLEQDPLAITDRRSAQVSHPLAGLPATERLLSELWHDGRLDVLAQLWREGLDVHAFLLEGVEDQIVSVPSSVMRSRKLWFTDHDGTVTTDQRQDVIAVDEGSVLPASDRLKVSEALTLQTAMRPGAMRATSTSSSSSETPEPTSAHEAAERLASMAVVKAPGGENVVDSNLTLPEWGIDSVSLTNLQFEIGQVFGVRISLGELAERPFREITELVIAQMQQFKMGTADVDE